MIKKLEVDNFKTLNHFELELTPMTVIVGNNASGKSSILQVISLLCSSAQEDYDAFLFRRNWNVSDLRSKCKNTGSKLALATEFELDVAGVSKNLRWELVLQYQKSTLTLSHEKVVDLNCGRVLMEYTEKNTILHSATGEDVVYPPLSIPSSAMKILIDVKKDRNNFPELVALKSFLINVRSYELLTPEHMRMSSRGSEKNLSISGKNLPGFIKNMSAAQQEDFLEKLKRLLGGQIESVSTETNGKPGWTFVNVEEKYGNHIYKISSRHLSDGMLRLLAFVGISASDNGCLIMLDEIENGINSSYAEDLIDIFKAMSQNEKQLILTTHSVVFLDFVDKDDIIYLYRSEEDGRTIAKKIFELPELIERLEYMYPGEIIYNLDNQRLIDFCMQKIK